MRYTFLSSPYSGDELQMEHRYRLAMKACAHLHGSGVVVFSPIVHWHEVAVFYHLPRDAFYWKAMNDTFLAKAFRLTVLCIDGWRGSAGVQHELEQARLMDLEIAYLELKDYTFRMTAVPPVER